MMASSRTALTSSGEISGVGLASAKINGLAAMPLTISGLSTPPADKPKKISASFITSPSVRALVSCEKPILSSSINSVRPV